MVRLYRPFVREKCMANSSRVCPYYCLWNQWASLATHLRDNSAPLKNQNQAIWKSASLKILHGWKTSFNEIIPLHISTYSWSLGFSCHEMTTHSWVSCICTTPHGLRASDVSKLVLLTCDPCVGAWKLGCLPQSSREVKLRQEPCWWLVSFHYRKWTGLGFRTHRSLCLTWRCKYNVWWLYSAGNFLHKGASAAVWRPSVPSIFNSSELYRKA